MIRLHRWFKRAAAILCAVIVLSPLPSRAEVPDSINYQGILLTAGGDPVVDGNYLVKFAIYDLPEGGSRLWTETQSVTTNRGLFTTVLGKVTALSSYAFNAPNRFLGTQLGADPEMMPRVMFVTVPYSHRVETVDGARGGAITTALSVGPGHTVFGVNTFVAGEENVVSASYSAVSGGQFNQAQADYASVGGGYGNLATLGYSRIGGGWNNTASGAVATVSGGYENTASGNLSTLGGGHSNSATGAAASVSGGELNEAAAEWSCVGGGLGGRARGWSSGVISGSFNTSGETAIDSASVVAGGMENYAKARYAFVGGGVFDTAYGEYSTVAGGLDNYAGGKRSMIPGGSHNAAYGDHSFAAGNGAYADHQGAFVWADATGGTFHSDRDNQVRFRASGGLKIDYIQWVDFRNDGTNMIYASNTARLTLGGVWTNASSRSVKENFTAVDGEWVLGRLSELPISQWNYRAEAESAKHIGPTAEDFHAAFGLGDDRGSISTIDPSGIALAAIQQLLKKVHDLEGRLKELEAERQ